MRIVVVLVLGLAACAAPGGQGTSPEPTPVDSTPAGDGDGGAGGGDEITGAFGGDAELEGGCAWIDARDQRWQVEYPDGYTVEFDPLALRGPDGDVVAAEGDEVTVVGAPVPDMMTACNTGPVFRADEVR